MFSVLLSLYHKEKFEYLEKCFESIWDNQSLKPSEIVLVLDGRIGEQLIISVQNWQVKIGKKLKIVALPQNVGLGKALNEGLKNCSYEWVFRMDTDDICTSDRFEKQLAYINDNPETAILGGQVLEFNSSIKDADKIKPVPSKYMEIINFSKRRNPFNHMTVAYKRSVILSLGGYHHHLFMEDYNLWLRVISKGYKVANLDQVLVYARVGNGMHSRRRGLEYIKSEKQLLDLKVDLKVQTLISAYTIFILRSWVRFLPSNFLGFVYNNLLRKRLN